MYQNNYEDTFTEKECGQDNNDGTLIDSFSQKFDLSLQFWHYI